MTAGEAAMAEYLCDVLLVLALAMAVAGMIILAIWPWLPGSRVKRPPFYLQDRR